MNRHQSITELYSELCIGLRAIAREKELGLRVCCHCRKIESDHVTGGRCGLYMTDPTFSAVDAAEHSKIAVACELVERIAEVMNWQL